MKSSIAHLENKIRYIKQFSLKFIFIHSVLSLIKNIRGRLKGYKKAKNIFILDEFLSFWRKRSDFKENLKWAKLRNEKTKNLKYIFFPLMTEPEAQLHGNAQDFFFQLSALNLLARDLLMIIELL